MSAAQWLPRVDRAGFAATRRVIVFPHAGSGVAAWARFGAQLAPDVEFRVVRLPGRESRIGESVATEAMPVIDELSQAAEQLVDLPQVLVGHSLGALLAFAVCSRLPVAPAALVASGQTSPRDPRDHSDLLPLTDYEFAVAAQERWGGIPGEMLSNRAILGMFLAPLRGDLQLADSFPHDAAVLPGIPVEVFAGERDLLRPEGLADWSTRTTGRVRFHSHPGGHMEILENPAVIAQVARTALEHLP